MAEWSKALAWKVSIRQKRIEGSNPSRSAISPFAAVRNLPIIRPTQLILLDICPQPYVRVRRRAKMTVGLGVGLAMVEGVQKRSLGYYISYMRKLTVDMDQGAVGARSLF